MGAQFLQQVLSKDTLQSFVYHTTKFLSKMSGIQPVAVYAMKVPPGDILVPAVPEFAAMFRVTMAAIDPSADPDFEAADDKKPARATLKLVRLPFDEDDDEEDMEDEDDEDDDDPEATMKAIKELKKIMMAAKGKGKAVEGEDDEDDEEDSDDESLELDEVVICTLDPEKNYQQPIDFVVGEGEKVFFKVSGTHTVHLTGNYVIPQDDGQASLYEDDDEVPKLVKDTGKGKNKRPAQDSEEEDEAN